MLQICPLSLCTYKNIYLYIIYKLSNQIKSLLREEELEIAVTVGYRHGGLVTPLLSDVNKISI